MGWRAEIFDSRSHTDLPVYHTDLLIWIGTDVCAVAADNIVPEDRARIVDSSEGAPRSHRTDPRAAGSFLRQFVWKLSARMASGCWSCRKAPATR